MPLLFACTLAMVLSAATSGLAADVGLAKQIELMQKQIAALQQEVTALKATFLIADGSLSLTVKKDQREVIGGNELADVGRNLALQVGGSASQSFGQDLNLAAGRQIVITAGDQLTLKSGQASIVLQKNGDISITGTNVRTKASGEISLKGAKIQQN